MVLQIENVQGSVSQELAKKIKVYFDDTSSQIPSTLIKLNALIGFPYRLVIDWQSIAAAAAPSKLDAETLFNIVNSSIHHFLAELIRLLEADDNFSENFMEKTKEEGRKISVLQHAIATEPFTRVNEDALYPTVELHLPVLGRNTIIKDISKNCGKDLSEAVVGLSKLDPLSSPERPTGGIPRVGDLPGPALAMAKGPVYIRIIETISEGRVSGIDIDGYPPVVELLRGYIAKHLHDPFSYGPMSFYPLVHRFGQGTPSIHVSDQHPITSLSAIVLANLLEGSLGFQRIGEPAAMGSMVMWLFQRRNAFMVL